LTTYLNNQVYNQAVFKWVVVRLSANTVNFDLNRDGQLDTSDWMTDEMQVIRDECGDTSYDNNIFLVDNGSYPGGLGFMDFGQRYGFVHVGYITSPGLSPNQVVAHELGHGAFSLTHTAGDNNNLMYNFANGSPWRLRKSQWDLTNP
jgi:hypothetical protein